MPSSVTDFLHHVHAEKSKSPAKNRPLSGNESEDVEDDNDGDRDNEHELYILHQHQQQLSEKLTAQLLRQRQQKLRPANRRNADTETTESGVNANPWERRNKRTYHDENLLMDYIIDMPVGENSENWNLVTNDDIGKLWYMYTIDLPFKPTHCRQSPGANLFIYLWPKSSRHQPIGSYLRDDQHMSE